MDFGFWWRRVLILRGGHHLLPVISANFVTVFSFIFFPLSILCMRRATRQRQSWATLTVLEDCTLLVWRRQTLELDFYLSLTSSLSISSYASIDSGEGGHFW